LIGVRGLYNFGRDFDDSYHGMLKESLRSDDATEETILLNNPDSGFIELEQENAESRTSLEGKGTSFVAQSAREPLSREKDVEQQQQRHQDSTEEWNAPSERIRGYWSAGAEVYYSATEKLGGGKVRSIVSLGFLFLIVLCLED
jgi:distribution and morphology protein 10